MFGGRVLVSTTNGHELTPIGSWQESEVSIQLMAVIGSSFASLVVKIGLELPVPSVFFVAKNSNVVFRGQSDCHHETHKLHEKKQPVSFYRR
jgi:hypothetical protein